MPLGLERGGGGSRRSLVLRGDIGTPALPRAHDLWEGRARADPSITEINATFNHGVAGRSGASPGWQSSAILGKQ